MSPCTLELWTLRSGDTVGRARARALSKARCVSPSGSSAARCTKHTSTYTSYSSARTYIHVAAIDSLGAAMNVSDRGKHTQSGLSVVRARVVPRVQHAHAH